MVPCICSGQLDSQASGEWQRLPSDSLPLRTSLSGSGWLPPAYRSEDLSTPGGHVAENGRHSDSAATAANGAAAYESSGVGDAGRQQDVVGGDRGGSRQRSSVASDAAQAAEEGQQRAGALREVCGNCMRSCE